jgi:hypothetical protein
VLERSSILVSGTVLLAIRNIPLLFQILPWGSADIMRSEIGVINEEKRRDKRKRKS